MAICRLNLADAGWFGPIPWQLANLGCDTDRHEAAEHVAPRRIDREHSGSPLALRPVSKRSGPGVLQHFSRGAHLNVDHWTRGNVIEVHLSAAVMQPEQTTDGDDPGHLRQPGEREELPKQPPHALLLQQLVSLAVNGLNSRSAVSQRAELATHAADVHVNTAIMPCDRSAKRVLR